MFCVSVRWFGLWKRDDGERGNVLFCIVVTEEQESVEEEKKELSPQQRTTPPKLTFPPTDATETEGFALLFTATAALLENWEKTLADI